MIIECVTIRLHYTRSRKSNEIPAWTLHIEELNAIHMVSCVVSTAPHVTETIFNLAGLESNHVIKYENADLEIDNGVARISATRTQGAA